jgi:hypothetical protein
MPQPVEIPQRHGRASDQQRDLPMEPDCQARATAAALVIATWMDDLPAVMTGAPVLEPIKDQPLPPGPATSSARDCTRTPDFSLAYTRTSFACDPRTIGAFGPAWRWMPLAKNWSTAE